MPRMSKKQITVALVSLGCPKNLVDSERMLADLAEAGCIVGAPMEDAEVIVINTCGFLASARAEAWEFIHEALGCKTAGSAKRVVVAGCMSNREGESILEQADGIDAVIGVNDRRHIVDAVCGTVAPGCESPATIDQPFIKICRDPQPYREGTGDAGRFRLTPPHTAYLRIAEGCSQKCTFCTIPSIRGPLRSKPIEMVLAEARELIETGALELNIIAQDTTAYGRDLGGLNLASLLRELNKLPGAEWLRVMYTYPRNFDDELIETIQECDRVLPYIDMPLQHFSTSVLKRMNRGVTKKQTEDLLGRLRDRIDGLIIRTSLIVGFPGETEKDFAELLDVVENFQFDALGVFEFSPEPGTPAAAMENQVPAEVAAERAKIVMQTQQEIVEALNAELVESAQPLVVLVDGVDSLGQCVGRYYGQAPDIDGLCILTEPQEPGGFMSTTVVGADGYDLIVQPENDE